MNSNENTNSGAFLLPNNEGLEKAAQILQSDNILAVPTETVYGLAGNALNPATVQKIFDTKQRPLSDPLIVHIHSMDQVKTLTQYPQNEKIDKLLEHFWPGAVTFIFRKSDIVPDCVTAGKESVAIRMPGHPIFRKLLQKVNLPIAAPSANPFSYISPTCAQHVYRNFGDQVPILDGGDCKYGLESTVVSLLNENRLEILRPGPISAQILQEVSGIKTEHLSSEKKDRERSLSPGLSKKHYSPRKPLFLFEKLEEIHPESSDVVVLLNPTDQTLPSSQVTLTEDEDLEIAAQKVFSELIKWDESDCSKIYFQKFPNYGIGKAVNDRLERAAAQS